MALSRHERRVVNALAEAMFPRTGALGLDAEDAGVEAWVDDYATRLPPFARAQVKALLKAFELGYPVWAGRASDRLVNARPSDRVAYLATWEQAPSYARRQVYEGLRAMLTLAYVESPTIEAAIRPRHQLVQSEEVH